MARQLGLLLLLGCILGKGHCSRVREQHPVSATANGMCDPCEWLVKYVEDYASQPKTEAELVQVIQTKVCPLFPESLRDQCLVMAPVLAPSLISWMRLNLSPSVLCTDVGVCGNSTIYNYPSELPALLDAAAPGGGVNCPVCQFLMGELEALARDPQVEEVVVERAVGACMKLPQPFQASCKEFVYQTADNLAQLLQTLTPDSVCDLMGICHAPSAVLAKPLPAGLVHNVAGLRNKLYQAQAKNDECDSCHIFVYEVSSIIKDPDMQQQLIDFAKQSCAMFGSYSNACSAMVDEYAPAVFQILEQDLDPDTLCATLGYCAANAIRVRTPGRVEMMPVELY